jgi:hypothetical protein
MTTEKFNTPIKRLCVFDLDATIFDTPMPETGKIEWSEKMGKPYPFIGWWGRPESLDLDIFDIKPFPSVLKQLKEEQSKPNTYVVILSSRMEKLRPQVEAILNKNNIHVNKVDLKRSEKTKGEKLLYYIDQLPDLKIVNVYEDRDTDIASYEAVRNQVSEGIEFNIYIANNGTLALTESSHNVLSIIKDEIQKLI